MSAVCSYTRAVNPAVDASSFRASLRFDRETAGTPFRSRSGSRKRDPDISFFTVPLSNKRIDSYVSCQEVYTTAGIRGVFSGKVWSMNTANERQVMGGEADLARLQEIAALPPDWNGYGAKPFPTQLIKKCEEILRALPVPPEIYPTARQSVQLQYELPDRSYLEFEVFADRTVCLQVPKRVYADATEEEISTDERDRIREITAAFYRRAGGAG